MKNLLADALLLIEYAEYIAEQNDSKKFDRVRLRNMIAWLKDMLG